MDTRWERLGAATGIVFFALGAVASFLAPTGPKPSAPADEVAAFFLDNADSVRIQIFLFALALAFFLWFLGSLRTFLGRAEGGLGRLSSVAFGGGVAGAGLLAATFASPIALASGLAETADPGVAAALFQVAHAGFDLVNFPFAVFLGAASMAAIRSKALPEWLGWAGILVGLATLVNGVAVFSLSDFWATDQPYELTARVLFFLWILVASITMVQRVGAPEQA